MNLIDYSRDGTSDEYAKVISLTESSFSKDYNEKIFHLVESDEKKGIRGTRFRFSNGEILNEVKITWKDFNKFKKLIKRK